MKEFIIRLDSVEKVKKFVTLNSQQEFSIDIISGKYIIDAKSIMGIFSLNLTAPITVVANTEDMPQYREYYNKATKICGEEK